MISEIKERNAVNSRTPKLVVNVPEEAMITFFPGVNNLPTLQV
jgi:hypothetical protein